jgi:MFS family permease
VVTDSIRPANSTAVAEYAKPKNLTKAYSLNRMAVNLGFSIGPAIGGFLAAYDYLWLFYADGVTCILAGLVFIVYFSKIKKRQEQPPESEKKVSANPAGDFSFLFFLALVAGYGIVFFQLFNTLPLYYREVYLLPENHIGWLLALNGFVVFLIEMPLVHKIGDRYPVKYIIAIGALLAGVALVMLNLTEGIIVLVFSMIVLSLSEILAMPFMTTYTVNLAPKKSRGRFLGMYSVAYSVAFIAAPALGTFLIDSLGYKYLWYIMCGIAVIVCIGILRLLREKQDQSSEASESGMG